MMRINKKDSVMVITGKDKGKVGAVIDILPKDNKIKVKDVAVLVKHLKARRHKQESGIVKQESYIDLSNVMPVCPNCSKPCRVKIKILADDGGKKIRICNKCQENI